MDVADPRVAIEQRAIARAEEAAAATTQRIAGSMGRPPTARDGVDTALEAALAGGRDEWEKGRALQNDQAARAEIFGNWSNAAVVVIAAVAALTAMIEVLSSNRVEADEPESDPQNDPDL